MTNEDAIKWLGNLKLDLGNPHYERLWYYAQAIDEICELLEAHEPRVMTLEEVLEWKQPDVWYEKRGDGFGDAVTPIGRFEFEFMTSVYIIGKNHEDGTPITTLDYYGKSWRCWTARPTDEQMGAVKWDG